MTGGEGVPIAPYFQSAQLEPFCPERLRPSPETTPKVLKWQLKTEHLEDHGDRAAQYSRGYQLVAEADGDEGAPLGAAGRSRQADVGFPLCTVFRSLTTLRRVDVVNST